MRIVAALRLDEQAAQAQQPSVLALGHRAERAVGAVVVTFELRRLRLQQQRQRIVGHKARRRVGMFAGRSTVAMADRQQAPGDGLTTARLALVAAIAAQPRRHPPHAAQQ